MTIHLALLVIPDIARLKIIHPALLIYTTVNHTQMMLYVQFALKLVSAALYLPTNPNVILISLIVSLIIITKVVLLAMAVIHYLKVCMIAL
jgi:hypothetical protein